MFHDTPKVTIDGKLQGQYIYIFLHHHEVWTSLTLTITIVVGFFFLLCKMHLTFILDLLKHS
jgi:hypothetical protein